MKRILAFSGIILLIALVWLAGYYVPGIGLEPIENRVYATIGILAIVFLIAVLRILKASRVASFMENLIKRQADDQLINARPDHKENIEAVRNQFFKSIDTLKKSKLGQGRRGASALYELPWYIIIGPPATGKSTLLRHSGLSFPLTDKKIQGIGGTKNCDWWFANDGIILDTAGRYTTEGEDKDEWLVFLDVLKKNRKKQPVNGVIVAIGVDSLINASLEEVEGYAEKIKERCDELLDKLEVKFPIYLMFTKCDLLDGFIDFFGDLTKSEREQVWGCTLPEEDRSSSSLADLIHTELDKLTKSLYNWRMGKLSKEGKIEKRERIFLFPLQFSDIHKKIIRFSSYLFQPNPYRESPILRGFYFTCGTQEGSPIDKIIGRINPAFAEKEKKSYFIKDCFTQIIFPDQNFAQLTLAARKARKMATVGSVLLSTLFAGWLIFGISRSYLNNKELITKFNSDAKAVAQIKWNQRTKFQNNFSALDNLKKDIIRIENYREDAPPMNLRYGLYQGGKFVEIMKNIYLSGLNEILVAPVKTEIERKIKIDMEDSIKKWDSLYSALKVYLLLSTPDKVNEVNKSFLDDRVKKYWGHYLSREYGEQMDDKMTDIAPAHISYYLSQISNIDSKIDSKYLLKADPDIVRKAQAKLNQEPAVINIYQGIKKAGAAELKPLRLKDILPPETRDILVSTYEIPGVFTKYGYDAYVGNAILEGIAISDSGDWVLGGRIKRNENVKEKRRKIINKLNQLYIKEYLAAWNKFVGSISISSSDTVDDLMRKLKIMANYQSSPFVLLFKKMIDNMKIEVVSPKGLDIVGAGKGFFEKTKEIVGLSSGSKKDKIARSKNPIEKEFLVLSDFSGIEEKTEGKRSGLEDYLGILRKIHDKLYTIALGDNPGNEIKSFTRKLFDRDSGGANELSSGLRESNYILDDNKSQSKEYLKRLLSQVFDRIGIVCLKATSDQLNKLWKEKVFRIYKDKIYGRYPFEKNTRENTSRRDMARFLMPNEGALWQFYDKELKPFISQENDDLKPRSWKNFHVPFTDEFLRFYKNTRNVRDSLFWNDERSLRTKFWIRPHPPKSIGSTKVHISKTIFHINGQELVYENGPEIWEVFSWPGEKLEQEGLPPLSFLEITRGVAGYKTEKRFEGEWSLFRLLDKAEITTQNNKFFKLRWIFHLQGEPVAVDADLKTESPQNPFTPGIFSGFVCPERLTAQ